MTWGQGAYVPQRIKNQVRRRDLVCQLQYAGCNGRIEQFDHITGLAQQGLQRTTVTDARTIQGVCIPCHKVKTDGQRRAGIDAAKARRGSVSRRYRDLEQHPGATTT